jgi:predicted metal-dependent HD superfamily phosphohydrolase
MSPDELSAGFAALAYRCLPSDSSAVEDIYHELTAAYTVGRHYHSLEHLSECFEQLRWWQKTTGSLASCELHFAIWYHDLVYVPGAPDNEGRSADRAVEIAALLGWTTDQQQTVRRLVESTAHLATSVPEKGDLEIDLISDIDLAILGTDRGRYQRYCRQIRAEYSHLSPREYDDGRRRVLERFLARPSIYRLPLFSERFESSAQENLRSELRELSVR